MVPYGQDLECHMGLEQVTHGGCPLNSTAAPPSGPSRTCCANLPQRIP